MAWNWICPFCDRAQTVTDDRFDVQGAAFSIGLHKYGHLGGQFTAISCANEECLEVSVSVTLINFDRSPNSINHSYRDQFRNFVTKNIETHQIRPQSHYKLQPEFIPAPIREDYYEACSIRDRSPKAAATLARRCLQGMIRDFCKIDRPTLNNEIEALRKQLTNGSAPRGVTEESIDAIDAVRSIGNIGAHMERDINIIVDVDPGEAQSLIELLELLFDEWYVAQHKREARLARVSAIAAEKRAELADAKAKILEAPKTV